MHNCAIVPRTGIASSAGHGIGNGPDTSNVAGSVSALRVIRVILDHALLVEVGMALLLEV